MNTAANNLRGILLIVLSMAFFAVTDMFIKLASGHLSTGEILTMMGAGGGFLLWALARYRKVAINLQDFFHPAVMMRNFGDICGTMCMIKSLALVDISLVSAILQATPILVTLGAVLVFHERVPRRTWLAICVGLIGVLLIIRPDSQSFDVNTLWAVAGTIGLALRDLSTRSVPGTIPTLGVSFYGMALFFPAGLILQIWEPASAAAPAYIWGYMLAAIILGVVGYYMITASMRIGILSVVAPFRYSRILFALMIGIYIFQEPIRMSMLLGVGLCVAAGCYLIVSGYQPNLKKTTSQKHA